MGFIVDCKKEEIGLELRRESIRIFELYDNRPHKFEHIFVSEQDGSFEISKEFLKRILNYFDDPKNREECDLK